LFDKVIPGLPVTPCTSWLRHATVPQAAVNRLVAGSNPARGAITKFGLWFS
jgi:hypothetical protein